MCAYPTLNFRTQNTLIFLFGLTYLGTSLIITFLMNAQSHLGLGNEMLMPILPYIFP